MNAWVRAAIAVLLGGIFVAALSLQGGQGSAVLIISDVGQLAAAAAAAAMCCWAALQCRGRERLAWAFLAAGTGSWAAGQTVWTYYEVALGVEVPFPSLADVGFLLFPMFAVAGLSLWRGAPGRTSGRVRNLLDGAIIAGSLLVLSWSTALGSVVAGSSGGWLAVTLSLAYPVADIILVTVVFLILGRTGADVRATLLLVAGGVACLAVADSAYVYLVAVGSYSSGDLVTSGWVFGFLLIAAGASLPALGASRGADRSLALEIRVVHAPTKVRMLLPYIPLVAAGVTIFVRLNGASARPLFDLALGFVLVVLVLARQFLAMIENHRLLRELEVITDQLQHQALHDPLTGLANRALFADRFEHALAQRNVDVSLLFCDLDDFKSVNDQFGHPAGDTLLRMVAERLVECCRPADTVARLGGDEFALLLEESSAASEVADRIVASMQEPFRLGDATVQTTVSVGIAHHQEPGEIASGPHPLATAAGQSAVAEQLLARADEAMYVAKASGKGQVVHADAPLPPNNSTAGAALVVSPAL